MNYRLKYEGSQRMLTKAMAQIAEQAAVIERAREALMKAGRAFDRLLRWNNQEPSGPSNATEVGRWVNQEIHAGLSGLKETLAALPAPQPAQEAKPCEIGHSSLEV